MAVQPADDGDDGSKGPNGSNAERLFDAFCHGGSFASTARNDTSEAFWESTLSQFGHDQNNCNIIQNLVEEIGRVLMMNNSIRI